MTERDLSDIGDVVSVSAEGTVSFNIDMILEDERLRQAFFEANVEITERLLKKAKMSGGVSFKGAMGAVCQKL